MKPFHCLSLVLLTVPCMVYAEKPVNLLVNGSFEATSHKDYGSAKELIEAEGRANGKGHFIDAYKASNGDIDSSHFLDDVKLYVKK